jgi:hypothetical protein
MLKITSQFVLVRQLPPRAAGVHIYSFPHSRIPEFAPPASPCT